MGYLVTWKMLENQLVSTNQDKSVSFYFTVWKFQHFSTTQILREINFEDPRSAKTAILTPLEASEF